jgi:hypothetical protein
MSVYRRSLFFTAWLLFVFLTIPLWWFGFLIARWHNTGGIIGIIIWLSHGAIAQWLLKCPDCGTSAFEFSKGFTAPWPQRRCCY